MRGEALHVTKQPVVTVLFNDKIAKEVQEMKKSELILKSGAGLVFLICVLCTVLFVSYGSFDYNLAWVYLFVFAFSVVWITVYLFLFDKHLLKSRLAAGPVAETRTIQKVIQSVAGLAFIGLFLISALDYKNKWSNVSLEISYAADIICALSFVLLYYVFKQNTFLSATIEVQEKQQVVSTGLYGVVRHPMYTGALVLLLFTPVALGSYYGLFLLPILIAVIVYRAIDEERELKQNLMGYQEYCKKVKYRLIPFIF